MKIFQPKITATQEETTTTTTTAAAAASNNSNCVGISRQRRRA